MTNPKCLQFFLSFSQVYDLDLERYQNRFSLPFDRNFVWNAFMFYSCSHQLLTFVRCVDRELLTALMNKLSFRAFHAGRINMSRSATFFFA